MNETPQSNPPIGRYIAIALLFVLIFVGASYLVYRFSRPNNNPNTTPSPTITDSSSSISQPVYNSSAFYSANRSVFPAPTMAPINRLERQYYPPKSPQVPIVKTNISGFKSIAQDGRGNLLFDNLTHNENYALQQARIEADSKLRLAQENNATQLARVKLTTDNNFELQQNQNQATTEQQLNQQAAKLAQVHAENRLELAKLKAQIIQTRLQLKYQTSHSRVR